MAAKKPAKKSNRNPKIDGKAAQLKDFSPAGRKVAEQIAFKETGKMADRADAVIARNGVGIKPGELEAVKTVRPELKNKNTTINSAANARVRHVESAATSEDHRLPFENVAGAGWYFKHHGDISAAAKQHGFDVNKAITASAVMSPQNSPDNEKASVNALMEAHASGKVVIPEHVATALNKTLSGDAKIQGHHIGVPVAAHELHPEVLAGLSDPKHRDHVSTEGVNLKEIARGGNRKFMAKAIGVLRGDIDEATAIDPHSGPKIASYRDAIRDAVPGTAEHHEYMARAAHIGDTVRGDVSVGQQMFDFWGKRHSEEGLLSSTRNTAEDTWMNSISHAQKNENVPGTKTNIMKTAGTALGYGAGKTRDGITVDADPRVKQRAVQHAVNNAATIEAGKKIKAKHGLDYNVPSVLVQEAAWTDARRAGDKDAPFNKIKAEEAKAAEEPKAGRKSNFTQGTLF